VICVALRNTLWKKISAFVNAEIFNSFFDDVVLQHYFSEK